MYLPATQEYLSRSQPQCPGVHTIRGPGGGGGVSACGAGGAVGAMIVVDTVLPVAGSSLVIVFFSMVVVDWAKAGAANSKMAPAATSGRIILIPSIGSRAASVAGRLWESTG